MVGEVPCGGVAGCVGVDCEWSAFFDVRYVMVSSHTGGPVGGISSVAAGVACVGLTVVSPLRLRMLPTLRQGRRTRNQHPGFGPFPDPEHLRDAGDSRPLW